MSKKWIALLLAVGMCFSLASCEGLFGGSSDGESSSSTSEQSSSADGPSVEESPSVDDSSEKEPDNSGDETPDDGEGETPDDGGSEGGNEEEKKEYVTVTFQQDGVEDVVKTVEKGTELTDIPTPATKVGYTVCWDTTDFSAVAENMVVTAIETAKTYTIRFEGNIGSLAQTTLEVQYGAGYQLPNVASEEGVFKGWLYNGELMAMQGVWNIDSESGIVVLTAKWIAGWTGNY